ncbi:hypothetical protein B0H14DRAFT_2643511 [Mycena olivaceomarginata]|nr:hypothetical protein B0H14DRAFT_2643511 [Mycena olivaceomarginata]
MDTMPEMVDELQDYPRPFESLHLSGSLVLTTSSGGVIEIDLLFPVDSAASWNESDFTTCSWRILVIFLSNSTDFHRNRPGLPGVVHYSYLKLLGSLPKSSAAPFLGNAISTNSSHSAQGSWAQWITLISSFCHPRLPGAVDYTYIKLLLHQFFSQPPQAPGHSVLHLYKASARSCLEVIVKAGSQSDVVVEYAVEHWPPVPFAIESAGDDTFVIKSVFEDLVWTRKNPGSVRSEVQLRPANGDESQKSRFFQLNN